MYCWLLIEMSNAVIDEQWTEVPLQKQISGPIECAQTKTEYATAKIETNWWGDRWLVLLVRKWISFGIFFVAETEVESEKNKDENKF